MAGISSVSYLVLVNGAPSGFIKPSRGIHQGDPLSPYLFLPCTEGFSALLRYAAHHGDLHGEEIKGFFNANLPSEKYLGLPPIIGRDKKQVFEDIKSKVQSKLEGWKGKLLSQVGRELNSQLLHNQDSLLYKIYKAKYFPNNSLLEATIPSHSSYAWRSITQGREIIKQGSCWRVSNGSLINIWADKWLPSDANQRVLSPRTILPPEARVTDLMEFSSFQPRWKTMLIDTIFDPFEALIIKVIPLSPRRPDDSLGWTRNRSRTFSIRSAYFLQLEIERKATGNEASSSNPALLHSLWNGIWSTQVPPKIKTFIWRACTDSLSTCTKLFERKVLHSFSCVLCNEKAETCDHLFLECSFAQAVWLQSPLLNGYRFYLKMKFVDAMNAALTKLSAVVFDTLCIACWMIWKCRNEVVFNNKASSYHGLWNRADLYRMEFVESSSVGIGLIIRNNVGEVLAAACDKGVKELNPLCTAACVLRKALLFCQSTSFSHVQVECNFAELVDLLNSDRICTLEVAWILEDIAIIKDSFNFISFSSIPLRCNRAALALANAAKEKEEVILWLEECPSFLFPIVQSDIHQ
ncbi:uncharacterized protein LOC136069073 [Quercus suber]|uniref:uncharacterized protein LOC136069073 n=1 Tax=Quercus suber TaxID=58331 RepID=UPI0032DF9C05